MNTRQLRAEATKLAKTVFGNDAELFFTVNIYRFDKDFKPVLLGNYETIKEAREYGKEYRDWDSTGWWLNWCFGPDGVYFTEQVMEVSFNGGDHSEIVMHGNDRSDCYRKFIGVERSNK